MDLTRIAIIPMVIGVQLLSGGCVNLDTPQVSPQTHAVVIDFTKENLSASSDMPMYTYHVPDSQVIIFGHQGSGTSFAFINGITVVSGDALGPHRDMMAAMPFEEALHISLAALAPQELNTLLDSRPLSDKFTLTADALAPTLSINGDVLLMFESEVLVRPYVILKAKLTPPLGRGVSWTMSYAATIGAARSLTGPNGWASEGGASLKFTVTAELQRVLAVMLSDVASPFVRNRNSKFAVQGHFPFVKDRLQLVGYLLGDNTDEIYFLPNMPSTSLLAGVNIMERSAITIRPARSDDPRMLVTNEPN